MTWLVYILRCRDGQLYTGITNDLDKRFQKHSCGKGAKFTRGKGPLQVVWTKDVADKSSALKLEAAVKKLRKPDKEKLVAFFRYGLVEGATTMTPTERKIEKGACVVRAWRRLYGTVPSKHAVIMVCAVGEHETICGDAWSHSGNWGAIQRRGMTDAEKAVVNAGGKPIPQDVFELLTKDSSPVTGVYQAWYWRFPQGVVYPGCGLSGDDAGAWKLLRVLLDGRQQIKASIDTITPVGLASCMYATRYFEGMFNPKKRYPPPKWYKGPVDDDGQVAGGTLDVADYARALVGTSSGFEAALSNWDPGSVAPAPEPENPEDKNYWEKVETDSLNFLLDNIREGVENCGPAKEED